MMGTWVDCRLYGELCVQDAQSYAEQDLSPETPRWSKSELFSPDCLCFCYLHVTHNRVLIRRRLQYRCLLHQVRCLILFHLVHVRFGTRRYYRLIDARFPCWLVHWFPFRVLYTQWSASYPSVGASVVFQVGLQSGVEKNPEVRTRCEIRFVAFWISLFQIPWHRVRRRVYLWIDCRLGGSADCVYWPVAYSWCNRLANVR